MVNYSVMEELGADPQLVGIIGSWGDTPSDQDVLGMLKAWNATGGIELH